MPTPGEKLRHVGEDHQQLLRTMRADIVGKPTRERGIARAHRQVAMTRRPTLDVGLKWRESVMQPKSIAMGAHHV